MKKGKVINSSENLASLYFLPRYFDDKNIETNQRMNEIL